MEQTLKILCEYVGQDSCSIICYYFDWENISRYQKLSEEFIEKYKDRVNWDYISCRQKLSEEFIEKYKDRVYWDELESKIIRKIYRKI